MDNASMLVDLCSNLERDMRRLAWVCQGMADLAEPMRSARDKGDMVGLERLSTMFAKLSDEYNEAILSATAIVSVSMSRSGAPVDDEDQAVRMTYTGKVGQA